MEVGDVVSGIARCCGKQCWWEEMECEMKWSLWKFSCCRSFRWSFRKYWGRKHNFKQWFLGKLCSSKLEACLLKPAQLKPFTSPTAYHQNIAQLYRILQDFYDFLSSWGSKTIDNLPSYQNTLKVPEKTIDCSEPKTKLITCLDRKTLHAYKLFSFY
jgi:hypothetical protein